MANHSIILTSGGLYGCGENHCGTTIVRDGTFLETPKLLSFNLPVSDIVVGHSVTIINSEGRLHVAGCNKHQQLGLDNVKYINLLTELHLPFIVRKVATGGEHTIIINEFGEAYGLGSNLFGQLGFDPDLSGQFNEGIVENTLKKIPLPREATDVACGPNYTVFNCGGQLYVCGAQYDGQLGIKTPKETSAVRTIRSPTHVPFDAPVTHISCGFHHTIVNADGLYITGEFMYGDRMWNYLRTTPNVKITTFTKVPFDLPVSKLCSGYSNVVIKTDDDLYAFGNNYCGFLGQGHGNKLHDIVKIPFHRAIDDVICGAEHMMIYSDGECYVLGSNMEHQLGLRRTIREYSPKLLPLPHPVISNNRRFRNTKSSN